MIAVGFCAKYRDRSVINFASYRFVVFVQYVRSLHSYISKYGDNFQNGATKKREKVVFVGESTDTLKVEGDPGQGREEDKDLYTTRTS
jgi:hypothetical protein